MAEKTRHALSSDSEDDCSSNSSGAFSFLSNLSGLQPIINKPWAKDKQCHMCKKKLGKLKGALRHHCRFCGETVCKEHSQHQQVNPMSGESVRCCDICQKKLVGRETKEDIERRLTNLRAEIAEVNREIVQRAKEIEGRQIAADSLRVKLDSMQRSSCEYLKTFEAQLSSEQATTARLHAMASNTRANCTYSEDMLSGIRVKHSEAKAVFTETESEVRSLRADVSALERDIEEESDRLRGRIPQHLVNSMLGPCCRPTEYRAVSFNASHSFDVMKFKESLRISKPHLKIPPDNKSCKCELM